MAWKISTDPKDFSASVALFREDLGLDEEEFDEIIRQARKRAFDVAGLTDLQLVSQVWEELQDAETQGIPYEDFKASIAEKLYDAWGGKKPWRVASLFRTNVQQGYSLGRFGAMTKTVGDRPFWRYSAIADADEECIECHDTVLRADDPWWGDHWPPIHFNCRCEALSLTEEEAKEYGSDDEGPDVDADDGFGEFPDLTEWDPDLSDYPDELAAIHEEKHR